jgi:hypothetical protein
MKKIYDQTRLAMLESRRELPFDHIPTGIDMAGVQTM